MNDLQSRDHRGHAGGLLSICFARSNSVHYPMAVHLAKQAANYSRLDDESEPKKEIHLALFTRSKEQAGHAAALLKIIGGWKTTRIYTEAAIEANPAQISLILECYFRSLSLGDYRAHCYWFDHDSAHEDEPGELIPCVQLRGFVETGRRAHAEDQKLKIQMPDRIHAAAIQTNCTFCPNFSTRDC